MTTSDNDDLPQGAANQAAKMAEVATAQPELQGASAELPDDPEMSAAAADEFAHYEELDEELAGDVASPPKARRAAAMPLSAKVEAVVFAAQKPLKTSEIHAIIGDEGLTEAQVQASLDELVSYYQERDGGFRLHYLRRLGYQFQTAESAGAIMERMFASRPRPISRAALETLSIIAYRQPVTRAEVEFIRGVDAGSIFKTLLERELIKCVGRKEIVGRPMLFGTAEQFLTVFNLSSIKDLPPLEAFQPAREMVQGAMSRLAEGSEDELIDVEEYIADSTRGEYEGDDRALTAEGDVAKEELAGNPGEEHGTNADSEVAVTAGNSLPAGSRDLDQ